MINSADPRLKVIQGLADAGWQLDRALDLCGLLGVGRFAGSDEVREELMRIGRDVARLKMRLYDEVNALVIT